MKRTIILSAIATLVLTACGGGGGSKSSDGGSIGTVPPVVSGYKINDVPVIRDLSSALVHYDFESLPATPSKSELCKYLAEFDYCVIATTATMQSRPNGTGQALKVQTGTPALPPARPEETLALSKNLLANYDELYTAYWIYFPEGYDQGKGGKLPGGIAGAPAGKSYPSGGVKPGVDEGFNVRSMFYTRPYTTSEHPLVYAYIYHQNQSIAFGDVVGYYKDSRPFDWYRDFTNIGVLKEVKQGYFIETRVKMNTPGQANGEVEVYINGHRVLDTASYVFSSTGSYGINHVIFSHFFGGDTSWMPAQSSYYLLDDFIVSTKPVTDSFK